MGNFINILKKSKRNKYDFEELLLKEISKKIKKIKSNKFPDRIIVSHVSVEKQGKKHTDISLEEEVLPAHSGGLVVSAIFSILSSDGEEMAKICLQKFVAFYINNTFTINNIHIPDILLHRLSVFIQRMDIFTPEMKEEKRVFSEVDLAEVYFKQEIEKYKVGDLVYVNESYHDYAPYLFITQLEYPKNIFHGDSDQVYIGTIIEKNISECYFKILTPSTESEDEINFSIF